MISNYGCVFLRFKGVIMNSMKKNCLVFGLSLLLFVAFTTAASAQFLYPPTVPFYGYNTLPPGFGYFPPAPVPPVPTTGTGVPYRGANVLSLTTLALLGLLPTTTTTTVPTLTSLLYPTTTVLPTTTLLPTTTTTLGLTTALLLGGVNTTTLLLLGI
jgi:hypothetical protein